MRKPSWNDTENAAVWALYFSMRKAVDDKAEYNKAAMIRAAQNGHGGSEAYAGILMERSKGSIEAKLMNCTAILHDLDRHDVSMAEHGYRPLSNYQSDLKTMGIALLAVRDEAVAGGFELQA